MQVPILKQGDILIATIQSALADRDLLQLQEDLVHRTGDLHSRAVIVDVTALDVLDSFACRTLRAISRMVRLRGAETIVVGVQPEVAFAMVQLGLSFEGARTALDLEEGLLLLKEHPLGGDNHGRADPRAH